MNVLYFIFMRWSQERSSCLCINIWWLCFEADLWQQWVSDFPGSDSCHIPGQQSCQRAWILTQSFQFPVTPEHWIHKLLLLRSWVWLHLFAQGGSVRLFGAFCLLFLQVLEAFILEPTCTIETDCLWSKLVKDTGFQQLQHLSGELMCLCCLMMGSDWCISSIDNKYGTLWNGKQKEYHLCLPLDKDHLTDPL